MVHLDLDSRIELATKLFLPELCERYAGRRTPTVGLQRRGSRAKRADDGRVVRPRSRFPVRVAGIGFGNENDALRKNKCRNRVASLDEPKNIQRLAVVFRL